MWIILTFLAFFVSYIFITNFVFATKVLQSDSMQPNLQAGDRFIASSYAFNRIFPLFSDPSLHRGNVVFIDLSLSEEQNIFLTILDNTIRFFTAQRVSLTDNENRFFVKRIIGLPGDEITMTNYVFRVRPGGSDYALTEFELWERPYGVNIPQAPALWDGSVPFSGNIESFVLGENEFFVLSDDRSNTNDSRTWGPIPLEYITGRAIFRYWPLNRLGRP
jgi:signal peptidase I